MILKKPTSSDTNLFFSISASDTKCYVETANLDGETNLKIKSVASKDLSEKFSDEESISLLNGLLFCEHPNRQE